MARRVKVRDFRTALNFTSTNGCTTAYTPSLTTFSVAFWVKKNSDVGAARYIDWQDAGPTNGFTVVNQVGSVGSIGFNVSGAVSLTSTMIVPSRWVHVVCTYSNANSTANIYINGALNTTGSNGGLSMPTAAATLKIGNRATSTSAPAEAVMDEVLFYNKELTATEVADLYFDGIIPTSAQAYFKFDEGAGTSATDSSGNGKTGTISGATYVSDVPMIPRTSVYANLVKNGDFEFAPPFTAATTTGARFIDGTAGGSATNSNFGWSMSFSGTASARFDSTTFNTGTSSLKISTLATASYIEVFTPTQSGSTGGYNGRFIPVLPSTAYTLTYWMKTTVTSGSATGANITLIQSNGAGAFSGSDAPGTNVNTTTGWTQYTVNLTTSSTTVYLQVNPRLYGHNGAGTLIMDAWFDDVQLYQTAPVTRTASSNRPLVRDFGTALQNGTIVSGAITAIDVSTAGVTISFWTKFKGNGAGNNVMQIINSSSADAFRINLESSTNKLFVWTTNAAGSGALGCKTNNSVPIKEWIHIAFTYNSSNQVTYIYVNGVQAATGTGNIVRATNGGVLQCFTNQNGNSVADNVRVWMRDLSASEILNDYVTGTLATSPLIVWKFDEGSGTTAIDSSGNGNNGTLTGATYTSDVAIIARSNV